MSEKPALLASYYTVSGQRPLTNGEISPIDFRVRAEACAKAGYQGMGLSHGDLMESVRRHGVAGIRSILDDNGMRFLEVEPIQDWFDIDGGDPLDNQATRELIENAGRLGAYHVKTIGKFTPTDATPTQMNVGFTRLAQAAHDAGTRVSLEMVWTSNVRNLAVAAEVIGESWQHGGGLTLDLWHFQRGHVPFSAIDRLPPGAIGSVELNDGTAELQGDSFVEMIDHRLPCGDGAFDIGGFLAALRRVAYCGFYGVEVLSTILREQPVEYVAQLTCQKAMAQFAVPAA